MICKECKEAGKKSTVRLYTYDINTEIPDGFFPTCKKYLQVQDVEFPVNTHRILSFLDISSEHAQEMDKS